MTLYVFLELFGGSLGKKDGLFSPSAPRGTSRVWVGNGPTWPPRVAFHHELIYYMVCMALAGQWASRSLPIRPVVR